MAGMTYTMTDTTKLSTAECYGIALCELGEEHKDVVALTADLAKSTKIGMFGEKFPDRFFNVGIAEQNLFGVAAGMAKNGLIPFASTFAIFASARRSKRNKSVFSHTCLFLLLLHLQFLLLPVLLTRCIQIFAIKMFL